MRVVDSVPAHAYTHRVRLRQLPAHPLRIHPSHHHPSEVAVYVHIARYPNSKWGVGHSPEGFEWVVWFNVWRFCISIGQGGCDS